MEGVDAGFLYMETPAMHMHTLKISLIRPRETFTFERFAEQLLSRLNHLPPMQSRILPAPFGLNHPLLVRDRVIDPDRHLFRHQVPAPGGMRELEQVIGEVASTPLDRSVPLWELHACEGMADGSTAIVAKIHHALADGMAANALLGGITDQSEPDMSAGSEATWPLQPTPSRAEQAWWAVRDAVVQALGLPGLLRRTLLSLLALVRHRRTSEVSVPRPILDAPRTSFNGPLTARRTFATCSLPLAEIKQARSCVPGATLNDVVLAVVGGAARRYLQARDEVPTGSLLAGVPVGTDPADGPVRLAGNRVSNLFTTLATDLADPVERLRVISRTTRESKAMQQTLGPAMLVEWVQYTPPAPTSAVLRAYSRLRAAGLHRPPFNVVVSNVRGPAEPVTIAGAELADLYSVGPILEGIGLNVTAWSYVDRLNFSWLTCPDLVGDVAELAGYARPALDELLEAIRDLEGSGR